MAPRKKQTQRSDFLVGGMGKSPPPTLFNVTGALFTIVVFLPHLETARK